MSARFFSAPPPRRVGEPLSEGTSRNCVAFDAEREGSGKSRCLCGDDDLNAARRDPAQQLHQILLDTDADPDVLLRVAVVLNTLNRIPESLQLNQEFGGRASIVISLKGHDHQTIDRLCRKLGQLTCIREVILAPPDEP